MIRCTRQHLAERCVQRGVTIEQAAGCIVRDHGSGIITVDETHPDYPRGRGLGDRVAAALSAVGVTKKRVSRLLGRPCGCPERQAWLNNLGRRIGIG